MKEFSHDMLGSLAYELPDEVLNYKMCGDYPAAAEAIERWLQRPVAEGMKERLRLELLFLQALPKNFPYTKEDVIRLFREQVADFGEEDLLRLDREGLAEWIFLNGEKHYIHNIVRNVTGKDEQIRKRAGIKSSGHDLKPIHQEMREKGEAVRHIRMRASIRLNDEEFQPGMKLKVHLPLPAQHHQISQVKVLEHTDCPVVIDPADAAYRAICFEDAPEKNREYYVVYEYTVHAIYHDFSKEDQEAAERSFKQDPDAAQYLGEQVPHIRFSPYLRALAAEIVGDEKRPLEMARKIYDYITTKVHYSYMREYFLIPDIPQYCARNLRGDCGVQALLFITLCRICGIPAKWQSGLYAAEGDVGPHDWALFYAEPYGWLFADPSFGGSAYQDKDEQRRSFYFGNLEPFRMAANNAFQQPFTQAKQYLPIDPYDNQIGEIESQEQGFVRSQITVSQEILEMC